MNLDLEGKTALVTAASGGIGSGIAGALADAGVRVAISARTGAALEQVAGSLASRAGGRPAIVVADVCAHGGPAQIAAEAMAALGGRVDILVNNTGGAKPLTGEADDAFWDEAVTLNFLAARRLTDLIMAGMKARNWGRIINISGALVAPRLNGAAPAKAALVSWSRTLSSELGPYGDTVNTIAPGRINTAQIQKSNRRRTSSSRTSPLATSGSPMTSGISWRFLPPRLPATSMVRRSRLIAAFGACSTSALQVWRSNGRYRRRTRRPLNVVEASI
ncbi:SDR family NAD(P)-dependent oxidoreductase [Bradyrhizobium retamae]|uniref:SDR family NAD(P)-dependent oxidoreductase n=1 Tax=Bradyrhizobium retamae TaxID=1300035 RepID=UPI000A9B413F|nr:SDR family NAD(P)-dependent oxidoreductase [Bradyrhizobium retamae]